MARTRMLLKTARQLGSHEPPELQRHHLVGRYSVNNAIDDELGNPQEKDG